jgi:hypothetical protein
MPIADLWIDSMLGNKVIRFLDGNAGYNQIFMAKEDVRKTVFRCPGFIGLFEWVIMAFVLNMRSSFGGGGRTGRSFQEDQRISHVSTHVVSSEDREPVQDVYCHTKMGYWSCSATRRRWQGVFGSIRESMST